MSVWLLLLVSHCAALPTRLAALPSPQRAGPSDLPQLVALAPRAQAPAPRASPDLPALRSLRDRLAWPELAAQARTFRAAVPRATGEWIEASALLGHALYELWDPSELERLAEDTRDAVRSRIAAEPLPVRSTIGSIAPFAAARALELELLRAHVLASRGEHERAAALFSSVVERVIARELEPDSRFHRAAPLALARSLLLCGRTAEGLRYLELVRVWLPRSDEAAAASVLLERHRGLDAYRGKYAGDPLERSRWVAALALVPRARARLAAALGRTADSLPAIDVGVADVPDIGPSSAVTIGDPRIRDWPPVVVLTPEGLAFDLEDPETLLVHELGHAVLMVELGLAYERLPPWATEAISVTLAGQAEKQLESALITSVLLAPQVSLFAPSFREHMRPSFEVPAGVWIVDPGRGGTLAFHGIDEPLLFVRRLIAELGRGRGLDAALEKVADVRVAGFLARARERVLDAFERLRDAQRSDLEEFERARRVDPASALRAAEAVLARSPRDLSRGLALAMRAEALRLLGRHEECLATWETVLGERRAFPALTLVARLGCARALAGAGRFDEARRRARALERDALDESSHQSALALAQEIDALARQGK